MTGELLYKPLRLPTSRPPLPPELRPAYTDVSLKRAIRDGIGPDGSAFSPFMPRYALNDDDLLATPVRQVYRDGDPRGETAAAALRRSLQARGGQVEDLSLRGSDKPDRAFWQSLLGGGGSVVTVLWLGESDLKTFWEQRNSVEASQRIYLSTTVYDSEPVTVPSGVRNRVYFVHPYELPDKLSRLLIRSTGWLRAKRIYVPEEKRVQANAYFALKMAGEGVGHIRGFFSREYFLERIEHMVDNATYTSVYPRISLAPNQRFVSKGCYIAGLSEDGKLVAVTDWLIPGSN